MRLSERELLILDYIIVNDEYNTYKEISKKFQITERMARYNIEKIELFLSKNNLPPLNRNLKKGFMVGKRDEVALLVETFKQRTTPSAYKYSRLEIEEFILLTLLLSDTPTPVSYFEETLFISRTSVLNSIKALENQYKHYTLKLKHVKRKGYKIEGDLMECCQSFSNILLEAINLRELYSFIETEEALFTKKAELIIFNLFDLDLLIDSYHDVKKIEKFKGQEFDDSFSTLLLTIIYKIRMTDLDWKIIDFMTKDLQELSKVEVILRSMMSDSKEIVNLKAGLDLKKYINALTKKIGNYYEKDLSDFSEHFFEQLNAHMINMIDRNRKGINIINPIFSEIMKDYPDLFKLIEKYIKEIESVYKLKISSQEISFLVIYFASEIENLNVSLSKKPNVLVVCVEGVAVSKMLQVQLNKVFDFNRIETSSLKKFSIESLNEYDFIISTIEIPDIKSDKIIIISNYLTKEDITSLKSVFNTKLITNKDTDLSKFNRIMETIRENTNGIRNLSKLELDLIKILSIKNNLDAKEIIPEIYFSSSNISIIEERMRWEHAIEIGTNGLEEIGSTLPSYKERIMGNIRKYGPYMVIAPRVMIVHAGMEDGVEHPGLWISLLKKGMNMKGNFPEDVQVLITIALKDKSTQRIMENIAKLSFDNEKIDDLLKSSNEKDIFNMVVSAIYK